MAVANHRRLRSTTLTVFLWAAALVSGCGRTDTARGPDLPPDLVKQAQADFTSGRYAQAATAFERIVRAVPTQFNHRKSWAYALAALGAFEEVDRVLRTAPHQQIDAVDSHTVIMLWRRAFNIYRYSYHITSPSPAGVFRAAAIRDALEAVSPDQTRMCDIQRLGPFDLRTTLDLLQLWVRWDQIARDADLCPNAQWLASFVVAEPERLRDHFEDLASLEGQADGAIWLHPDDQGNWLAHPGVLDVDVWAWRKPARGRPVADELTETAGPGADLAAAWTCLVRWLGGNVPSATVSVVAAVRPERDRPFDQRLILAGRLDGDRLVVEQIGASGPADALWDGHAEYRRLLGAPGVTARSSVEVESLAGAYSAAGLPTTAFHVDEQGRIFASDRAQLACLLSFVRYGGALFGEPVVMTTAPLH
jgi:hypothetical protein